MTYKVEVYNYADHPDLVDEIIAQIKEGTQLLVVIDREKDDCIHVSPHADRDMYQAVAIAKALNDLENAKACIECGAVSRSHFSDCSKNIIS